MTSSGPTLPPHRRRSPGLLWGVAAVLTVVATFEDIAVYRWQPGGFSDIQTIRGFWRESFVQPDHPTTDQAVYSGINVLMAAAVLALADLLFFLSRRRWAAIVAGTFGTGMTLTLAMAIFVGQLTTQPETTSTLQLGTWLLTGAALAALAGLVLALLDDRTAARWEPPTPPYGIPVLAEPTGSTSMPRPVEGSSP